MREKTKLLHGIKCLHFLSEYINKAGLNKQWNQKFVCLWCKKCFILNGNRGTYTEEYKEKVIEGHTKDGIWVRQCCRHHGISTQTYYNRLEESYQKKKTK
jgi:transposase-like protein